MDTIYDLLVWAEDVGKFSKEYLEKSNHTMIDKVFILGDALKIGDLKALQEIKDLTYEIDTECIANRSMTEIFLLGRCYEQSKNTGKIIGLVSFTSLAKETLEFAKNIGIPTLTWNATTVSKRTRSVKKEPEIKIMSEKEMKIEIKKKNISNIIYKSALPAMDKDYFLTDENLSLLVASIQNASDAKIGLPMQLQIRFGKEKAEKLNGLLEKLYKEKNKEG